MLRHRGRFGILLLLVAAACNREAGAPTHGAPPELPHPVAVEKPPASDPPDHSGAALPEPPPSAVQAPAASAKPPAERPFALVELAPTEGDLLPLLREHAKRGRARKLKPFVEFYADWCKPCRELARYMDAPLMIEAFQGTYIVKINFDDWQDKLAGTGFVPRKIPVFYAIRDDGRPTGQQILVDAKGGNTPENMAPKLKIFFQE